MKKIKLSELHFFPLNHFIIGVAKTTPKLLEAPAKQGIWLDSR